MSGIGRHSLFGVAVLAAAGVPYGLSALDEGDAPGQAPTAAISRIEESTKFSTTEGDSATGLESPRPLEGAGFNNFGEIFHFDVTTAWILGRWPRVISGGHGANLHAYRVPLVTGTRDTDLAGSLTYCFNPRQQLEQIHFQGSNGDARPLVAYLTERHGFVHQRTNDPGEYVYQVRRDGRVASQLRITTEPVVEAAASTSRFRVELSMERPSDHRWFSPARHSVDGALWQ